jgi:hypothetical protein
MLGSGAKADHVAEMRLRVAKNRTSRRRKRRKNCRQLYQGGTNEAI